MVWYNKDLWARCSDACPAHLFGSRVWPYQSHQSQEKPRSSSLATWPRKSCRLLH
jgi:hypothetical protein